MWLADFRSLKQIEINERTLVKGEEVVHANHDPLQIPESDWLSYR